MFGASWPREEQGMDREQLSAARDALADGARWRPISPYAAATAEPKPKLIDQTPAASHARWVKSILSYERRETSFVEGPRYG
jgi:hypothetical protein